MKLNTHGKRDPYAGLQHCWLMSFIAVYCTAHGCDATEIQPPLPRFKARVFNSHRSLRRRQRQSRCTAPGLIRSDSQPTDGCSSDQVLLLSALPQFTTPIAATPSQNCKPQAGNRAALKLADPGTRFVLCAWVVDLQRWQRVVSPSWQSAQSETTRYASPLISAHLHTAGEPIQTGLHSFWASLFPVHHNTRAQP